MTTEPLAAREFAALGDAAYLNHAASAPLPARSAAALRAYADARAHLVPLYQAGCPDVDPAPLLALLARLLDVPASRVALVPTTADAISGAINSIPWRPGDNLVVPANEYPGVLHACRHAARFGVEVRVVPVAAHLRLDALRAVADARTRALVVSHVHWHTGHRIDLAELAAAARPLSAFTIVDAIQGVGALPLEAEASHCDVLAAGAYKWLLGIPGAAVLAVSERWLAETIPDRAGKESMRAPVHGPPVFGWRDDAWRHVSGGPVNAALVALKPSLELLLDAGITRIASHVRALLDHLVAGAAEAGLTVLSDLTPARRGGFVSVTSGDAGRDDALVHALVAAGIVVARRGPGIRVAPHLHNRLEHVERLLVEVRRRRRA